MGGLGLRSGGRNLEVSFAHLNPLGATNIGKTPAFFGPLSQKKVSREFFLKACNNQGNGPGRKTCRMNSFAALRQPAGGPIRDGRLLAADETVPLSLVPVNSKPLYVVFCCRLPYSVAQYPGFGCGKLRARPQNAGFTALKAAKPAQGWALKARAIPLPQG